MLFNRKLFASSILFTGLSLTFLSAAELKLATPFADHMVLQREKPVPVWGWADAGESITVEFAGQKKTATANSDGKWTVKLDPLVANDQPQSLVVKGSKLLTINDVLVGEVWLGSGQSNMAMTVKSCNDFDKEQAAATLPLVRMFKEGSTFAKTPQTQGKGTWEVCSPDTVGGFSATLYFFGREIHRELKVPVGLINSSVGGTPIEAWIDADVQRSKLELKPFFETQVKEAAAFDEEKGKATYQKALAKWEVQRSKAKAEKQPAPAKPRDPLEVRTRKADIGGLFNGKISPLIPYAIRGVLWYQGEANAQPSKSAYYQYQLPLLVTDWRARWGEELPMAWVQLPNFQRDGEYWMEVREAMLKSLKLPRTGMAIAIDIGDAKNIHPKNKQEVGKRLSLWALGDVYRRNIPSTSGPLPLGHEIRSSEIAISFSHADGGLKANGNEPKGFVIAGQDHQWRPAKVRIEGSQIIASSTEIKTPVAVRYNWAAVPDGNLVNGHGLPATPFRTDDWIIPAANVAK